MGLISGMYEWKLKYDIKNHKIPEHIVLVLSESDLLADEGYGKIRSFVFWCK